MRYDHLYRIVYLLIMIENGKNNTNEAVSIANSYYDRIGVKCPLYLDHSGDKLIPRYSIPVMNNGDDV